MTEHISLRATIWTIATNVGFGILILIASAMVSSIVRNLLRRLAVKAGPGKQDILLLFAQFARIAVVVFGAITALGTMGMNVSALVGGLGLTGFALGFAFRDALSNILAGAMILFCQPFRRDDQIKVAGFEGKVIEINLRYTVIQLEASRALIPNSNLLTIPTGPAPTISASSGFGISALSRKNQNCFLIWSPPKLRAPPWLRTYAMGRRVLRETALG